MESTLDRNPAPPCPRMKHYEERRAKERADQKRLDEENMKYIMQISMKRNDRNSQRRNWLQTQPKKQEQKFEEEEEQLDFEDQQDEQFTSQNPDQNPEEDFYDNENSSHPSQQQERGMIEQNISARRKHPQVLKPQIDHQKKVKPLQKPQQIDSEPTSKSVRQPTEETRSSVRRHKKQAPIEEEDNPVLVFFKLTEL